MLLTHAFSILLTLHAAPLDRPVLEACLAKKDESAIKEAFKQNEEETLPFFDEYLEGGLATIEQGGDKKVAKDLHAKGVAFAKLADAAHGGDVFAKYATAFAGWSTEQQKQFREGQAEYRKGREQMAKPEEALPHFEKSAQLAAPLGDTWGHAMCLSKIAVIQHQLGRHEKAVDAVTKAIELNASIHLLTAQAQDLVTRADCYATLKKNDDCEKDLRAAVAVIKKLKDEKSRTGLATRCTEIANRIGNTKLAEEIKAAFSGSKAGSHVTSRPVP